MAGVMQAPTAPANRRPGAIEDVQARFAAQTLQTPVNGAFRNAFLRSKVLSVYTHPTIDVASRDRALKSVTDRYGAGAQQAFHELAALPKPTQPVPGGVGYGLFYTDAFKTAWGQGTAVSFDIVCPTPPGGNVNTWLYLTATNRSGLGVEAFISYNGQNDTHFLVFDWARTEAEHWQTDMELSKLADYLDTATAHGTTFQVLPVWNSTWLVGGSTWRNEVFLYHHVRGGWDRVYQYDYQATDAQQKAGFVGSWAPIVETFQPLYTNTSQMGALNIQLMSADDNGQWSNWALLGAADSTIRTDNVGFHSVFLDPNYAFAVAS